MDFLVTLHHARLIESIPKKYLSYFYVEILGSKEEEYYFFLLPAAKWKVDPQNLQRCGFCNMHVLLHIP